MKEIRVEMADCKIALSPDTLIASGIGSCVAVCAYDSKLKIGGLAHIMLPHSKKENTFRPYRFADLAIPRLISQLETKGSVRRNLEVKLVGGSNLFPFLLKHKEDQMGFRNVEAAKEILKEMEIQSISEHTGGTYGRSVRFSLETGIVTVEIKI